MKYLFILIFTSSCAIFDHKPDYSYNLMHPRHKVYKNGHTASIFCETKHKDECFPWGIILSHKVEEYNMTLYEVQYQSCFDKTKPIIWLEYWCIAPDYSVPRKKFKKPK